MRVTLVSFVCGVGVQIPQISQTNAFYAEKETVSGNSFGAGYWIPELTAMVDPARPDGEEGYYTLPPCITLTSSLPDVKIYYEYSDDGNPKDGGSPYAGGCILPPEGDPVLFQAIAVNEKNDEWVSAVVSLTLKIGSDEEDEDEDDERCEKKRNHGEDHERRCRERDRDDDDHDEDHDEDDEGEDRRKGSVSVVVEAGEAEMTQENPSETETTSEEIEPTGTEGDPDTGDAPDDTTVSGDEAGGSSEISDTALPEETDVDADMPAPTGPEISIDPAAAAGVVQAGEKGTDLPDGT